MIRGLELATQAPSSLRMRGEGWGLSSSPIANDLIDYASIKTGHAGVPSSGAVNASTWQEGGTSQTPEGQKLLHVGLAFVPLLYLAGHL